MTGPTPPRRGLSLSERSQLSGIGSGEPAHATPAAQGRPWHPRHCWVEGHRGWPGRWPGVILQWRQDGGRWQGRVVFVIVLGHEVCLVEQWLDADVLRSA